METEGRLSLEQIRVFLGGSEGVALEAKNRAELYQWVNRTLREQGYDRLGRASKGLVRQYMAKMTGLGRAQVTRLIARDVAGGEVKAPVSRRHQSPSRYTGADSELLAGVDEAHGVLSGPATQKILQREFYDFGDVRYHRLARISAAT